MAVPSEFLEPGMLFYALGVVIQLGAATTLFVLAPGDIRHRSFAVLLVCNAVWDLVEGLYFASQGSRVAYYESLYHYLGVWSAAALAWFLSVYPRRRRHAAVVGWTSLAVAVGASLWFALDHGIADTGAFGLFALGWTPLLALGAFFVLREADRRRDDPRRWSMILVASALLVYPLSQAITLAVASYWSTLGQDLSSVGSVDAASVALVEAAYLLSRIAALLLVAWTIRCAFREPDHARAKGTFVASMAATIVLVRLVETFWGPILPPLNALVFGILVAYALARAHLFDIDLRLKLTISRGTIIGLFAFVFIVVSQMAQFYVEQRWGQNYLLAGVACGLLLFALTPIQRWADRLAHRVLPHVEKTPVYTAKRKRDMYLIALAEVWQDGRMTAKERRLLEHLARQLGLTPADLQQLETEVARILPPPKSRRTSA